MSVTNIRCNTDFYIFATKLLKIMQETLEDLLLTISWRENETERKKAEEALNLFINKISKYAKALCISQSKYDISRYNDLYSLLIQDVWENAPKYDDKASKENNGDVRVKIWLGQRIKAVVGTYWNELTKDKSELVIEPDIENFMPYQTEYEMFEEVEFQEDKVGLLIEKEGILSKKELDIIQTHIQFKGYVPNVISEAICRQYNISEINRRVIKSRALKKLEEFASKRKVVIQ